MNLDSELRPIPQVNQFPYETCVERMKVAHEAALPVSGAGLILRCSKGRRRLATLPETPEPSDFGLIMLALIASRIPGPVEETSDRDPGFLTLAFAIARVLRRGARTAYRRHCRLIAAAGGPFPL